MASRYGRKVAKASRAKVAKKPTRARRGSGRKPGGVGTAKRRATARAEGAVRGSGRKPQGRGSVAKRGSGRKPGGVGPAKRASGATRGSGRRPQGAGGSRPPKKDTRTRGGQGSNRSGNDQAAFDRFVRMTPEEQRYVMRQYARANSRRPS